MGRLRICGLSLDRPDEDDGAPRDVELLGEERRHLVQALEEIARADERRRDLHELLRIPHLVGERSPGLDAPEVRGDARLEAPGLELPADDVVRAGREQIRHAEIVRVGHEHQDAELRGRDLGAQDAARLERTRVGELRVEQDEVRVELADQGERVLRARGPDDPGVNVVQDPRDLGGQDLVLGHEDDLLFVVHLPSYIPRGDGGQRERRRRLTRRSRASWDCPGVVSSLCAAEGKG
jgi:hypothetical protein